MPTALCVGHLSYDITLPLKGFPQENTKYQIEEAIESSGGPAANAAALIAAWGITAFFMGRVGNDSWGERALIDLSGAGVRTDGVFRSAEALTPLSTILVNMENGSRTIINRKGRGKISRDEASACFRAMETTPPDLLLFDGHEPEASLMALECFPQAVSVLDAGSLREGTELLAPKVDYCVASERFSRDSVFSSLQQVETAGVNAGPLESSNEERTVSLAASLLKHLLDRGVKKPVITLGERGYCYAQGPSMGVLVGAFPAKAIDTTGAGDIFHGAFAAALLKGESFEESLKIAAAAASLSVERWGGKPSIPKIEEVKERTQRGHPSLRSFPISSS